MALCLDDVISEIIDGDIEFERRLATCDRYWRMMAHPYRWGWRIFVGRVRALLNHFPGVRKKGVA